MEQSDHVMLAGRGAEIFAKTHGCETVPPAYFFTTARWDALMKAKRADSAGRKKSSGSLRPGKHPEKYGTVGAVALDRHGNLAAATSTGGMTNKRFGRIGDSPLIGAGTYADNNSCAVSCTGWGEYFIRLSVAKSVADRIELAGMSLETAARQMIQEKLAVLGGDGGLIGVDRQGNIVMKFNTSGMYRAFIRSDGSRRVVIFR